MSLNSKQYAQALFEALAETDPKDHDAVLDKFVKILSGNGDENKLPEIEEEIKKLTVQREGEKNTGLAGGGGAEQNENIISELNEISRGNKKLPDDAGSQDAGGIVIRVDDELKRRIEKNTR